MIEEELKVCPFCGGKAYEENFDRLAKIGCKKCKYHIHGPGLLQTIPNDKPILEYKSGPVDEPTEWYHYDAYDKLRKRWNTRHNEVNKKLIEFRREFEERLELFKEIYTTESAWLNIAKGEFKMIVRIIEALEGK